MPRCRCRGHRLNPNSVEHTLALRNNIIEPVQRLKIQVSKSADHFRGSPNLHFRYGPLEHAYIFRAV